MAKAQRNRQACECGCGELASPRKRFVQFHAARVQPTGDMAYRWNGGQSKQGGYVLVYAPDHPRANRSGYVRRGIIVAEQKIGRPLAPGEVVHHINQIRDDDRPENIDVLQSQSAHIALHNRTIRRAKKLTEDDVREIKRLLELPKQPLPKSNKCGRRRDPQSARAIGERFGVDAKTIASIRRGEYWKWVH